MLYIGTTNDGKVRELAEMMRALGVEVGRVSADICEPYETIRDNARAKAEGYALKAPGHPVLVEDSGLFVPALSNLPGPWSARFHDMDFTAGAVELSHPERTREETDRLNNERVLHMLRGRTGSDRYAEFRVCLMLVGPDRRELFSTETAYAGTIAEAPRGANGFGYDPIFIGGDTFGRTFGEIDAVRKNLRSHRKAAMDEFFTWASQHVEVFA